MDLDDRGLILEGVTARAGSFTLGPIDLEVKPGGVLAVLGPSGAGKTVLLETIAGFRSPIAGSIGLDGRELSRLPPEDRAIGFVFQDAALFPHLSVRKNVGFALRARGARDEEPVEVLLERFEITHLANRSPRSLSGGERQRVALARALAAEPSLLLLDEPLSALDRPTREDLRTVLQRLLSGLGIPAIHVTHDRDEALTIGDEVAIVAAGKVRQLASPREIVADPADEVCARLLGWSELGVGKVHERSFTVGGLELSLDDPPENWQGPVGVFYRPEAVLIGADAGERPRAARFRAIVDHVLPTTPLVRVVLSGTPALAVLLLPRDLERLDVRPGASIDVGLPSDSVRVFPLAKD